MAGIVEFYQGQDVFVTGATGFMGKVLIEKILRFCPDVGNIYVLVRPKRGKHAAERISDLVNLPLFDVVRHDKPENLKKIVPLQGDCRELGLGLSQDDRKLLEERVSIVFHGAATVKFDDPIKSAVIMNTRGTREVMMVVRHMKKLKVIVHISTTYCQCDKFVVDEVMYPPPADWREIISIVETVDEEELNVFTPKILGSFPNTYTFTKSLAEHVVKDLGENLPVVIIRPSIVISTLQEPFPGWVDSFNGPVGLLVGGGKGIVRITYADPNTKADYMPVDVCIQFMLIASWYKFVCGNNSEPSVYNSSSHNLKTLTMKYVIDMGIKLAKEVPFNNILWIPNGSATKWKFWYFWNMIFLHFMPALLIDGLLRLSGKQPMLLKVQKRVYTANMALSFFTTNTWQFNNDKLLSLRTQVLPNDKKHFNLDDLENTDHYYYFKNAIIGGRYYLLKEHPDTMPTARKHYRRLCWINRTLHVFSISAFSWFVYHSALLQSSISSFISSFIFS